MWIQAKAGNEGHVRVYTGECARVRLSVSMNKRPLACRCTTEARLPHLTHTSALVQQPALPEDHDSLHQCTAAALLSFNSSVFLVFLHLLYLSVHLFHILEWSSNWVFLDKNLGLNRGECWCVGCFFAVCELEIQSISTRVCGVARWADKVRVVGFIYLFAHPPTLAAGSLYGVSCLCIWHSEALRFNLKVWIV